MLYVMENYNFIHTWYIGLSPVDSGVSRGVTDLYPSRGYTHPVAHAIEVSHAACKAES